jgi:RHS repeat-associated protein
MGRDPTRRPAQVAHHSGVPQVFDELTGSVVTRTYTNIVYDGFGNRVSETAGGVTTKYLVEDDANPTRLPQVMDEIVGGAVTRTYTYGLQRIDEDQIIGGTWTPSFYGYDGGGSVRQLTNLAGTVTDTCNYDAFGNKLTSTGSTPNNYLYRGEQYDPNLNLYYLRSRYYSPQDGRFMSRDPEDGNALDPRTLHKYLYAGGDPVNRLDPTGRFSAEYVEISTSLTFGEATYALGYGVGGLTWFACAVEFSWSLSANTLNAVTHSGLSSPPPGLSAVCGLITLAGL